MDNTEEITCLSLCTGYGGIELGLKRVVSNLRTIAYVEREAFAVANLVAKIETGQLDAAPIWTDVKTFDGKPFCGKVDIIFGGYPCQSFSVAGKRLGSKDPRHLWPHIARIVQAVRPVWCFFENVSGHLTLGFPEVYRSLRDMGYKVEAGLFTAAECGAPHRRERLFILAKSSRARAGYILRATERGNRSKNVRQENGQACTSGTDTTSELANANRSGSPENKQSTEFWANMPKQSSCYQGQATEEQKSQRFQGCTQSWPARPEQPQYEWEEPRVVMGRLNPSWVESLMGIPCNWTGPLYNGTKNKGDSCDDANQATKKGLSVLRKQIGTKAIQRKTGGFWGIPEKKVLQSPVLCLRQNFSNSKQKHSKETSIGNKDEKVCEVRPRRTSHSERDLGEELKSRIDRLRLLGNGVVPQCAEKAFRCLMTLFAKGALNE